MKKIISLFLVIGLLISCDQTNAGSSSAKQMEKKDVEKIVRDYILENPDVIIEAMKRKQQREQEKTQLVAKQALKNSIGEITNNPLDPVAGNPDGDVVLVEFFDYNCGYCKHALGSIQEILKTDKNIKVIFKEMPILGESSIVASQTALAVYQVAPEKYFDFHIAVMHMRDKKSQANLIKLVEDLGINADKVKQATQGNKVNQALASTRALSKKLNIRGTPAFIIDDQLFPGMITAQEIKSIIKGIRAKKSKK